MTCVTGNTHVDNVLVNVLRMADLIGCESVPVFRGAEEPLVHKYDGGGSYFHGKDGFNDVSFDDRPGRQFNRKILGLSFGLKNGMRF